ncbi:MAG TPA: hypothetical protein VN376_07080 [Longilinea sp.]|nr:hypothetical protein [Longilinea sp.]
MFNMNFGQSFPPPPQGEDPAAYLRFMVTQWLHAALRPVAAPAAYVLLMVGRNDQGMIAWLQEKPSRNGLDSLVSSDCQVLIVTEAGLRSKNSLSDTVLEVKVQGNNNDHGQVLAELFGLNPHAVPGVIVFKELSSTEFISAALSGMGADETGKCLHSLLDIVGKAARRKKDPVEAVDRERNKREFTVNGMSAISPIKRIFGDTTGNLMDVFATKITDTIDSNLPQ